MKCKDCGKRMKTMLGDTVISVGADDIQVKNLPIFVCLACGNQLIHEIVIMMMEREREGTYEENTNCGDYYIYSRVCGAHQRGGGPVW